MSLAISELGRICIVCPLRLLISPIKAIAKKGDKSLILNGVWYYSSVTPISISSGK